MEERAGGPTIGLVDDHPIMRSALRGALEALRPPPRFAEAADLPGTLALVADHPRLDLLLMDLRMPGVSGLEGLVAVRDAAPTLPIAVVSAAEDQGLVRSLFDLGIAAFIPKTEPPAVIVAAVRVVLEGGQYFPPRFMLELPGDRSADVAPEPALTSRQRDVLRLLAKGLPNKLIARELGLTEGTVKVHLLAIFRTLGARNRTEAVLAAQRRGLPGDPGVPPR
ncbi:MAG TPA: response regulator transcription factor [Casimicrobiaceae bacterium]|jgi:DNA-binding NarL/FixJ family response regulator|nr:response regulator transcription factor [Casimicrobiaceae bacterium]